MQERSLLKNLFWVISKHVLLKKNGKSDNIYLFVFLIIGPKLTATPINLIQITYRYNDTRYKYTFQLIIMSIDPFLGCLD